MSDSKYANQHISLLRDKDLKKFSLGRMEIQNTWWREMTGFSNAFRRMAIEGYNLSHQPSTYELFQILTN